MPNIPCPVSTPCINPANPITNYSSEAPDKEVFLGFGSASPIDTPNPGQIDGNPWGYFYCSSTISQDAADLCGYNGAVDNTVNSGGTSNDPPPNTSPDTGAGNQVFWNDAQTATVNCPDGGSFSYTVPAMSARASSLSYANTIALSLAKKLANKYLICISNISGACLGDEYDQFIKASTQTAGEVDWQLRSGVMPPGLALLPDLFNSRQISISGTPTLAGNYLFVLRATDSLGNFTDKTFNLAVLGFTNSPSAATVGTPYSFQFTAAGGTAPYAFSVPPGHLPAGLTMSDSGLITGTPTEDIPTTFTVTIEENGGQICEKEFTITPSTAGCASQIAGLSWSYFNDPHNANAGFVMTAGTGSFSTLSDDGIHGAQAAATCQIVNTTLVAFSVNFKFTWSGTGDCGEVNVFDNTTSLFVFEVLTPFAGVSQGSVVINPGEIHDFQLFSKSCDSVLGGPLVSGTVEITCV